MPRRRHPPQGRASPALLLTCPACGERFELADHGVIEVPRGGAGPETWVPTCRSHLPPQSESAPRHADPRTTMHYDRARTNLDRHPNYILAAYMASGT